MVALCLAEGGRAGELREGRPSAAGGEAAGTCIAPGSSHPRSRPVASTAMALRTRTRTTTVSARLAAAFMPQTPGAPFSATGKRKSWDRERQTLPNCPLAPAMGQTSCSCGRRRCDPPRWAERQRLLRWRWRHKFQRNLRAAGLLLEEERSATESCACAVHFAKLSAPWELLVFYAEELSLRAPPQVGGVGWGGVSLGAESPHVPDSPGVLPALYPQARPNSDSDRSAELLRRLRLRLRNPLQRHMLDFCTCTFCRSELDTFLGSDSHDSYFSNTQRHLVILTRTVHGKQKRTEMGIAHLLAKGVYTAAFPLHEVEMSLAQLSPAAGASGENSGTSLQPSLLSSPYGPLRGTRCLVQTSTLANCCTYTGPTRDAGTSTSPWTTYESTLGRRWPSTLPG
ncbi:hypothetical protein HPG69_004610 [Diceros bicornis minor]|uniref:Anoctamin dimerisation domain-containing protein n=1 Tax=Diceros bicornis minor TaxID=77932 RepID=A0A7J7FA14_DICBM|nr:hypothetical protein HPG69_004610 [Diceros bicornis minor]